MEVKMTITKVELTKDDVVTILADALYGCDYLSVKNDEEFYERYEEVKDKTADPCIEDKITDILFDGGAVTITDLENEEDCILTLEGLYKAIKTEEGYDYAKTLLIDEDGDYYTANNLLQMALFGEVVYG